MIRTIQLILDLFEPRDRRLLYGLLGLFILMALVQTLSVASILPFMSLVGDPNVISENPILSWLYTELGFTSTRSFLVFVGFIVLGLTAFSNALNAGTHWAVIRFGWHQQYKICLRLLSRYLSEPYQFFLTRNTADLTKTMFVEVQEVITGLINPGMKMIAQAIVVVSIFLLLLMVDPVLAVVSTAVLGGAYGILYTVVRREQARLGKIRVAVNADRFRTADEALNGIKESKILGRERAFVERFSRPAQEFSRVSSKNATVIDVPRYGLETLAFGGILVIVLYMLSTRDDFGEAIAVMSLYALAGYRLMPALQQVFTGLAKVRFFRAALESVHEHLRPAADSVKVAIASLEEHGEERLPFEREIRVEDLSFRYPDTDVDVLKNVSLGIPIRTSVGLVGGTGSGKTTLVDLVLGLMEPTEGRICVDSTELKPRLHARWRRDLGYVPQDIFLCDDTIARNIAFGLPDDEIDLEAVQRAATMAQIHEFVSSLPRGYDTVVGERGVRLSGGQRQRIGIARALYNDPEVLILDEATSALDGITEDALMDSMQALAGRKTMILIAHRVTTLKDCDVIYLFGNGRIKESGTYDELMERSAEFRAMAKTTEPEPELAL